MAGTTLLAELGLLGPQTTHDFDLQSCYPTSTSTIWDVDYLHSDGVILRTVNNHELTLDDFAEGGPLTPFIRLSLVRVPQDRRLPLSACARGGVDGLSPHVWACSGRLGGWSRGLARAHLGCSGDVPDRSLWAHPTRRGWPSVPPVAWCIQGLAR